MATCGLIVYIMRSRFLFLASCEKAAPESKARAEKVIIVLVIMVVPPGFFQLVSIVVIFYKGRCIYSMACKFFTALKFNLRFYTHKAMKTTFKSLCLALNLFGEY